MRVDTEGLVVSELAAADVDAVVLTPAHHYPTGVVMTAERRSALIAWARQRRALIVEDDYDVEYRFGRDPVASLQGLAPDLVTFIGTTSKTLAPALRLAWMVPPAHLIDDIEDELDVTGTTPPTLDQIAMASFIQDAGLERHLRSMRRRYRAKRDVFIDALGLHLPEVRVSGAAAGLHLLAWLPDRIDEQKTAARARRSGVGVHELHRHCTVQAPSPPALLLGYALPTASELSAATCCSPTPWMPAPGIRRNRVPLPATPFPAAGPRLGAGTITPAGGGSWRHYHWPRRGSQGCARSGDRAAAG